MSVFAATEISRTYTLVVGESELIVNGEPGEAAVLFEGSTLRIFFAEEIVHTLPTSLQWFDEICRHCKIEDATSRQLLFAALTDPDYNRVCKLFAGQGHKFPYIHSSASEFWKLSSFPSISQRRKKKEERKKRLNGCHKLSRCSQHKNDFPLWEPGAFIITIPSGTCCRERIHPKLEAYATFRRANYVPFITERDRKPLKKDPPLAALDLRTRNVYGRFWRPGFS